MIIVPTTTIVPTIPTTIILTIIPIPRAMVFILFRTIMEKTGISAALENREIIKLMIITNSGEFILFIIYIKFRPFRKNIALSAIMVISSYYGNGISLFRRGLIYLLESAAGGRRIAAAASHPLLAMGTLPPPLSPRRLSLRASCRHKKAPVAFANRGPKGKRGISNPARLLSPSRYSPRACGRFARTCSRGPDKGRECGISSVRLGLVCPLPERGGGIDCRDFSGGPGPRGTSPH